MVTHSDQIPTLFENLRAITLMDEASIGLWQEGSNLKRSVFKNSCREIEAGSNDIELNFFDIGNHLFDSGIQLFDFGIRFFDFGNRFFDFDTHFLTFGNQLVDFGNQLFDIGNYFFDIGNRFFDSGNRFLISAIAFAQSQIKSVFWQRSFLSLVKNPFGTIRPYENPYAFAASGMASADPSYDQKIGRTIHYRLLNLKNTLWKRKF